MQPEPDLEPLACTVAEIYSDICYQYRRLVEVQVQGLACSYPHLLQASQTPEVHTLNQSWPQLVGGG